MIKESTNLFIKPSFFCFGKKKEQEKPSLMLRRLLELGKKASGLPLEFSRRIGQFQFPLRFFASPNTPTTQRHKSIENSSTISRSGETIARCNLAIIKSGLRLVSVKKLSFLSRPEGKFFTLEPEQGAGEFEKLGEKSEILAGGSRPAALALSPCNGRRARSDLPFREKVAKYI